VDPVSLIVAALVGGVAAGSKDVASGVVRGGYEELRDLVRRRLSAAGRDVTVLDATETQPQTWQAKLTGELSAAAVGEDVAAIDLAQQLLGYLDPAGTAEGKYQVDLRWARGVQVGDFNTQHNQF
jgi:hypothetical protein